MKLWRGQPDYWNYKPSPRDVARFWIGIGVVFVALSIAQFMTPPEVRDARWGWTRTFRILFGQEGDVIAFAVIGALCFFWGLVTYRSPKA